MSKARKAKVLQGGAKQTTLSAREKASAGQASGGGGAEQQAVESWTFQLVDTTPEVTRATKGVGVSGAIRGGRVAVSASFGLLGFAPADTTRKIIEASRLQGGVLAGEVISGGGKSLKASVRLWLR
jgi:hypothetical protein